MDDACPACGEELSFGGPRIVLGSNEAADLLRLYDGGLSRGRCAACGHDLGREPTVAVGFDAPAEVLLYSPPTAPHREDLIDGLREETGDALRTFESLPALRQAATERLRPRVERARALVESDDRKAFIGANLVSLTPGLFAAAALALDGGADGLELPADGADALAAAQADVWALASIFWMNDPERTTLEDTLGLWVDDSSPLPGALEAFDARVDAVDVDEPWVLHYSHEAARATLHRLSGGENPRRLDWATLFFGYELAVRKGQLSSALARQAVSDERAQATVDQQTAWITAGELLRRGEPEAILADICEKAGHAGLVAALLDQDA